VPAAAAAQRPATAAPTPPPAPPAVSLVAAAQALPASPALVAAAPQSPAPAAQEGQDQPTLSRNGAREYTGNPVSLDFQQMDLRAVLRLFSEISGLNIVIDPAVQGSVDVRLEAVPWDQALDIILRANKLGYIVDGTIIRIAPLAVLADEEAQRRKLQDEQALAGELRVMTHTLSYARGEDLVQLLTRSALSQRGSVQVDQRTNTLILTDLQERLNTASELLQTLDRPQPQVEIEARIVTTTADYARSLGINWNLNGRVDPALGNTTNLAFPNSGTLTGGTNLPIAGPAVSTVGVTLGSVNGAFNLDAALSALESSGNGRLLSTPRVSTQNNVPAEITQGTQIPIQTVANNTVTVTFKDAALTLRVTPQITASNTVIMRVELENATPDFGRSVNGIPPIDTQRASTTVLVNDGETTVIGGIYLSREAVTTDRTPGLSQVPLLKWLFKRDTIDEQNSELLIFITPRIFRG
jgi:type IV pilus assembly protein PilQ